MLSVLGIVATPAMQGQRVPLSFSLSRTTALDTVIPFFLLNLNLNLDHLNMFEGGEGLVDEDEDEEEGEEEDEEEDEDREHHYEDREYEGEEGEEGE